MRLNIIQLLLPATLLWLASCSSTEIVPGESPTEKSSLVNLSIIANGAYNFGNTRDGDIPQLRLTARLYALSGDGSASTTPLSSVEILHRDTKTNITFEIGEQGKYCVTIFADHIDGDAVASDNHYPDKYYTYTSNTVIAMTEATNIADFFNNEDRECYVGKVVFTKGPNEYNDVITLTRPISKVRVAAPSDAVEDLINSVQINQCSILPGFTFAIDNTETIGIPTATPTDPLSSTGPVTVKPDGKTLFYYYTFASSTTASNPPALGEINLSLNPKDGIILENTDPRIVPSDLIKPIVNHLISINGKEGWINAKPGGDDITVHIHPIPEWSATPGTIR